MESWDSRGTCEGEYVVQNMTELLLEGYNFYNIEKVRQENTFMINKAGEFFLLSNPPHGFEKES
jgi:hypothetical protein